MPRKLWFSISLPVIVLAETGVAVYPGESVLVPRSPVVPKRPSPSFLIFRDQKNRWRWNFAAANGRVVAASTVAYERREGCVRALRQIRGQGDVPVLLREQPLRPAIEEEVPAVGETVAETPVEEVPPQPEDGTLNLEANQILH